MPFAEHSIKFTLSGTINGAQSWSTGFWAHYGIGAGGVIPSADAMLGALVGSTALDGFVNNWLGAIDDLLSTTTRFTQLKYSVYGEGADDPSVGIRPTPIAPIQGSGATTVPPEVAVVASLRTGKVGASYRGRMYLPLLSCAVTAAGQIPSASAIEVANSTAALFTAIGGHSFDAGGGTGSDDTTVTPGVFSAKLGLVTTVTQVSVDERFDAQRRREDKLPGVVHTAAV